MNFRIYCLNKNILLIFIICICATPAWARNPSLDIMGVVSFGYDDNVNYSEDNELSDFITRLNIGLQYLLQQKTQSLEAAVNFKQDLYADISDLNNFAQDLDILFKKELSKYERFHISEAFEHAEEPTSFKEEFGRESGRFDTYKNKLEFEYNKNLSPENELTASFANEIKEISRDDLHDSIINDIDLEFNHAWSPKTSAFFKYHLTHIYVDAPDNAFIQTLAPGFRRYLTPQLLFKTYAGANIINTFDQHTLIRPTIYASLTDELDKRSALTVAYKKDHSPTGYSADLFDQWQFSLQYERQLSNRLKGYIDSFYGQGNFIFRDITEKLTGFNFGLKYSLSDNWDTDLSFRHINKDSDTPSREYKKNTIFFGFIFKF